MSSQDESQVPDAAVERDAGWSWIWIVPIGAAVLAAALAVQAWGERGLAITIHFDNGYGLKAGDVIRHRGIVVGEVRGMTLGPDLAGVVASVRLDEEARDIARVGSRFWVVRPQFGLARITGLDTVVGSRYLDVLPGHGEPQHEFVGLGEPPVADALLSGGLDVVLEGRHRGSLQPGSPVNYRKIRVGTVLSVGLASDARTVEVHARIRPEFTQLVRSETRFWDTSGIALDVGLTGITLHLDTLGALIMGGISMATPSDPGPAVATGHRFRLHSEAKSDWLEWDPALPVGHRLLPAGVPTPRPLKATLSWTEGGLWDSAEQLEAWVIAVDGGLLGPATLFTTPEDAKPGSVVLQVAGEQVELSDEPTVLGEHLLLLPTEPPVPPWPRDLRRRPADVEDCLIVAIPGSPIGLDAARFEQDGDVWHVDPAIPFDASWYGACVVARSDGKLLGLLIIDEDDEATVALLP